MTHQQLLIQVFTLLGATVLIALALLLLSFYNRLFRSVRNKWLRKNLATLSVALVAMLAILLLQSPEMISKMAPGTLPGILLKEIFKQIIIVVFVFNTVWLILRIPAVKRMSFVGQHAIIIAAIVISAVFIYLAVYFADNGFKFSKTLHTYFIYAYFNSVCTGLIYTAINYVELERKRKLNEKELEVTKLIALKTKAELDALHSKINPHFLYNALNSIADLSVTDGRKARKMTIALADLFRYSINYSQNNYSTVRDEVAMTEVYLEIEKIRFEDQLTYSIHVDEELAYYLIPRFILQPLVENAVKHGLKATGRLTEIILEIKKTGSSMAIIIADNGPAFPDELVPGYGLKSIFDKLDLLFPGEYAIHFRNEPRKEIAIYINKLMKNEPGV